MKTLPFLLFALVSSLVCPASAEEVTLENVPPVVVKTVPEAGAAEVDAKLAEIKVTFSKPMQPRSWSWATISPESFPKIDGAPKYLADERTCVLPVKLEPGKTYAIWINSEKFTNFKDTAGHAAVPYLVVFKTGQQVVLFRWAKPGWMIAIDVSSFAH